MNILVVNDDGIHADGLNALIEPLAQIGQVYVIAPDSQRSGSSHSLTMRKKLKFVKKNIPGTKMAFSLSGNPADCTKMGLALLNRFKIKIDLVVSGINHGGNLGEDVIYSGTCGAAREGILNGVMGMAVSLDGSAPTDFKHAAEIAKNMALTLKRDWIENPKFFLNINVPDISAKKIKGFKVTKLGIREYVNWFEPKDIGEGTGEVIEVFYGGTQRAIPKEDHESIDNDVEAVDNGYIAITPVFTDATDVKNFDLLTEVIKSMDCPA